MNIAPDELDGRTGLPAGALLTAIFLQKSYSDDLPELGYMILMDKIYLVAYALIVLTLVRAIYTYKATTRLAEGDTARFQAIHAMDKKFFYGQLIAFGIAVAIIINTL